uniref:DNA sequence from clone AEHM-28L23 n=1 Tax=Heliconius melpomene TaxID=34740 RepID=C3PPF1_HELME|nr:unnamed protein product [Heliconius melpomene]
MTNVVMVYLASTLYPASGT